MDPLQKALGDISSIRRQVARTTEFRGYGPATLAATGALALGAAAIQAIWLPNPESHLSVYLRIWTTVALVCAALAGAQMFTRTRRMHSSLSNEMIRMALEQFLPSVVAGALITIVIVRSAPASAWVLPGIWQIIFSLGILASCRFLPRWMVVPGLWYLLSGLGGLSLGDSRALSPWAMGVPFTVGQLMVASVLFFGAQEADDET
jgi:hypothetical protein